MIQTLLKYIGKHHLMPTVFMYIIHQNRLIKTQAFREIHFKKRILSVRHYSLNKKTKFSGKHI